VYFIVSLRVYVCDYVRASVSGLLRPFLSGGFYPLNLHSFIHSVSHKCSKWKIPLRCGLSSKILWPLVKILIVYVVVYSIHSLSFSTSVIKVQNVEAFCGFINRQWLTLCTVDELLLSTCRLSISAICVCFMFVSLCSLWQPCVADADTIFSSCGFFYLLLSSYDRPM